MGQVACTRWDMDSFYGKLPMEQPTYKMWVNITVILKE